MQNLIETVQLKKSFTTEAGELHVLKGIDLSISEGKMVGIVGVSGVGKSTLLHILGALDRPTSGKVFYNGTDIFSLNEDSLAVFRNRTVGFVFQFHHLLPEFTALENIMMPGLINRSQYKNIHEKAERLLNEMGLSERQGHRPGELSGGEQQRVAVARALILEPKVVLADEPTGNLDTATGDDLFKLLLNLNKEKGITFVIVTHNESLSIQCHRILRMVDGKIIPFATENTGGTEKK
ncbi:MAG: ABC transporter ATP-binding protein [Nitrospira sp.]|nr:ABC transporter ATP-binding protein [Nitrospira sp.]